MSSAVVQNVTRKGEEEEVANKMILEEQEPAAFREVEADVADAKNIGEMVVRKTVEEPLLHVVGGKAGVDVSSDFFSQYSSPGLQHQDFAFFKCNDNDGDSDEDDALTLTFHNKDDKLEVLKQLPRGNILI